MPTRPRTRGGQSPTWSIFLRNHAGDVLACDVLLVVTATLQGLYVFVVLDIATRRVAHWNLTAHPTAEWTIQRFGTAFLSTRSIALLSTIATAFSSWLMKIGGAARI